MTAMMTSHAEVHSREDSAAPATRQALLSAGWTLGPLLLAYALVGLLYPRLAGTIPLFLGFILVWVLVPGYAIGDLLLGRDLGVLDKAVLGGIGATACLTLLGLVGAKQGFSALVFAQLGLTALGIARAARLRRSPIVLSSCPGKVDILFAAAFCLVAIFVFVQFLIPAAPPTPVSPGLFYQDSVWTVGNTKAILKWGLPLRDIRLEGFTRSYHVAQNLFQVAVARVTGADPFDIHFYLEPLWDWFLITYAVVRAPSVLLKLGLVECAVLAAFMLFCRGIDGCRPGGEFWDPLSFGFGLPAVIVVHLLLLGFLRGDGLRPGYSALLIFVATAAKSILIFYVGFSLGLVLAWQWWRRRVPPSREVLIMFGLLLPMAAVWKLTAMSVGAEGLIHLAPVDPASIGSRLIQQNHALGGLATPLFAVYRFTKPFTVNLPRFVLYWPPALLALAAWLGLRRRLEAKVNYPVLYVAVFAVASIGTAGIVNVFGGAHYFVMYPQLLATLLAVFLLQETRGRLRRGLLVGSAIGVVVCGAVFGRSVVQHAGLWGRWPGPGRVLWDPMAGIEYDEWVACQWLRQRAKPDATFFSNRRSFLHEVLRTPVNRFFGYSTLTGLTAYAEGEGFVPPSMLPRAEANWARVNRFLDAPDPVERAQALAGIPAQYFVEDRRASHNDYRQTAGLSLIYETPGVRIFENTAGSQF
jgi:hypothetical protein